MSPARTPGGTPESTWERAPARTPAWRKLLLATTALLVALLLAEAVARVWLGFRARFEPPHLAEQKHCEYDEVLGWRNLPGVSRPDIYGPGLSLNTNARGFRALEEYDPAVPAGRYRVVCLGDSFTMGYGVDDRQTYPASLEHACPQLQAVNMGLGGYGLGQDYLWYRSDGVALDTQVLLFAFIDADFNRLGMDVFGGFPKPRMDLVDGHLVQRNVPVPRGWTTEQPTRSGLQLFIDGLALVRLRKPSLSSMLKPPPAKTEAEQQHTLDVAAALFDALAALSRERGQAFVLVYFPTGPLAGKEATPIAQWVAQYAARTGTPFVDLGAAFAKLPADDIPRHFLPDRHFSAAGSAFVARHLLAELPHLVPGFPRCDG